MMRLSAFRVTLLESSIIIALLSLGYRGAILAGRKCSWVRTVRPTLDVFEAPLLEERIKRKERLLASSHSRANVRENQQTILAEALLHPALLAHPDPRHIIILTNSTLENRSDSYMDQVRLHKSVEKVRILHIDEFLRETSTVPKDGPWIHSRQPSRNATNSHGLSFSLEDNGKDDGEIAVSILFVDSTVDLAPAELAVHIHSQPSMPFSNDFTMIVELMNRSIIPDWVKALADWDTVSDVTIRLPLSPSRQSQLRNYLLAFQDSHSEAFWHRSEAEWNRKLLDTLHETHETHESSFVLDSTLMSKFEYPSKQSEVEFCRNHGSHKLCQTGGSGFDPSRPNVPVELLNVQRSQQGEHSGRGVFTTVDIAPKSYIGIDSAPIRLQWTSTSLITQFTEAGEAGGDIYAWAHDDLEAYFDGYGCVIEPWGMFQYYVDATKLTFVNHGCNSSNNVGSVSAYHEANLQLPNLDDEESLWFKIPDEYLAATRDDQLYFPIRSPGDVSSTESNQFIAAGQEILDNYMPFAGTDGVQFWRYVESLRQECSGVAGFIEAWETRFREDKKHVSLPPNLTAPLSPFCERQPNASLVD